ncbi:BQ2448_1228 [Microbotryum intermedium]|uniref:BQ2448_1228 protein n=1 Tax=Microbotryum intermedium TaxID=269621 RepID=A0A238FD76_9BASI|nr:BQ2448_1228 [Microbotryum intermedium]
MSHDVHTSGSWYDSEDVAPDDHDTSSSTTSHRRTSESTEPSSRSSGLSVPTFVPSTSQNIRNDRLQSKIRELASSSERDGGGKSLGASTKLIKRARAGNGVTPSDPPPTFKGGVVGQAVEIDPRVSDPHKRARLTAPPRRLEELMDSAIQMPLWGRRSWSAGTSGSKAATFGYSHTTNSEQPRLPNLRHNRISPPPDWLVSILSEGDNQPMPPRHQRYLPARPAPGLDFSTNEGHSSHRPHYQPVELPPIPYSLPADLHNPVRLGGPSTPSRPFFEAQLSRLSPTRTESSPAYDNQIHPDQEYWSPPKHPFISRIPDNDLRPCTPLPIPRAQSIFSSPSFENSHRSHHSPLDNFGQLHQNLEDLQEDVVTPYEPILHSSSSDRHKPSLFSSDSELGNDFWTRPNLNDASLIRAQPIDANATSSDRYAASLARMAREQARTNSTGAPTDPRFLISTPIPSLMTDHRAEPMGPRTFETPSVQVDQSERLCTPPPPLPPRTNQIERDPNFEMSLPITEENLPEGPPPAEIFIRASSAPPMQVLDGEALVETQGSGSSESAIRGGVQDEEMEDGPEDHVDADRDTKGTAGDSMVTGFVTTTITENLTTGIDEQDEDDLLLQRMIEDEEIDPEVGVTEGESSWSFWEDTQSEMYDD